MKDLWVTLYWNEFKFKETNKFKIRC